MTLEHTPFKIVLESWGHRTAVKIEPRQVDKPTRPFNSSAEAVAFAEELSRVEGWPIVDRRQ